MAPFAIAIFPLRFHLNDKKPATKGNARAIMTIFQNPNGSRRSVKPMAVSNNPQKKARPEPDKKPPCDSFCGLSISLFASTSFTLPLVS